MLIHYWGAKRLYQPKVQHRVNQSLWPSTPKFAAADHEPGSVVPNSAGLQMMPVERALYWKSRKGGMPSTPLAQTSSTFPNAKKCWITSKPDKEANVKKYSRT